MAINLEKVLYVFQKIKALNEEETADLCERLKLLVPAEKLALIEEKHQPEVRMAAGFEMKFAQFFGSQDLIDFLREKRIQVVRFPASGVHLRLGDWDFWPKSDKWVNRKTRAKGQGEPSLLADMQAFYRTDTDRPGKSMTSNQKMKVSRREKERARAAQLTSGDPKLIFGGSYVKK